MRGWLAGIVAMLVCVAEPGGAAGGPIDCAPTPTVACLSAAIFSLAKTLPADSAWRRHVRFAEQELAPGNIKTALEFMVADNPDSSPWEDIEWIARAGRFDRAISRAKQRSSLVERLGGLLAVATHMLDKNDRRRAARIVDDVERELPPLAANDGDDYAGELAEIAAEIRVHLGQIERAARLLGKSGVRSFEPTLSIAKKYPAAASLRELAWREAERANEPWVWRVLIEDAKSRGDKADVSRAAQQASRRLDGETREEHVGQAISLARLLLEAGLPDLPARLATLWRRVIQGKDATSQYIIINDFIPLLASLALDQDVESAANAVSDIALRSECFSKAAKEYFRIGRDDVARKFDAEALRVATLSPTGDSKLQWHHDSAFHNLALVRADHGDIQGALDVAAQLSDEARVREVTSYVVRRAIDSGHGLIARPAIQVMERQANSAQDAGLLLEAANYWYQVGEVEDARRSLAQALKMAEERRSTLDARVVAELMWRIDRNGEAQALVEIVDKLQANDPGTINQLVDIVTSVSPAVAVQLTGRLDAENRIWKLASIAIQIAEAKK